MQDLESVSHDMTNLDLNRARELRDSWIGAQIDDYRVDALLAEGPFSWVFKAVNDTDGSVAALKVAKPPELSGILSDAKGRVTRGLVFTTGGIGDVRPDPHQLLAHQSRKLRDAADSAVVSVEPVVLNQSACYMRMEYVHGHTLREKASSGPVPLEQIATLCDSLDDLSRNPKFGYHGDLKPENILVDAAGRMRLIDTGYFGPLDCWDDNYDNCIVTTPGYYPELKPDDLLAVGIVLWEIACKQHPLDGECSLDEIPSDALEEELVDWVREAQGVGQYFLIPLLYAGRPSTIRPDLSAEAEHVLLKGLRLKLTSDGKLGRDSGFETFSDLAEALRGLIASGTTEL